HQRSIGWVRPLGLSRDLDPGWNKQPERCPPRGSRPKPPKRRPQDTRVSERNGASQLRERRAQPRRELLGRRCTFPRQERGMVPSIAFPPMATRPTKLVCTVCWKIEDPCR